jgi:glycosyltransferase involved in cell wall biosynthesis
MSNASGRPLRVLVVGTCSPHVANHIRRISGDSVTIEVISNGTRHFDDGTKVHLVDFSMVKCWNFILTTRKIREVIRSFKPDVLHIHQANSVALFSVLANRTEKLPTVLTAWGSDILQNPSKSILLKWLVRYVLRRVSVFTSDAVYMADEMRKLVPEKELEIVICNFGVRETNIPIVKEKIVYSNRNHNPLYRIDKVLEGFQRFTHSDIGKDWKMIIAGQGSETDRLKELSVKLGISGQVEFIGFVDHDTNNLNYARSKFYVSLPESDATAVSLLEAMYYGCIPILSDLPANREWVKDGVNGVIVNDLDSNYYTDAFKLDAEQCSSMNRSIILEKGTQTVSRELFLSALYKAMEKKVRM